MKSNIYSMLESFFDEPIVDIAKKLKYDEDNILILESDEEGLKLEYPETYNNLLSCKYNKDARTFIEYAQDLICSWIFEDYLLLSLKEQDLKIELSGEDKNRKILKSAKVSASSDYFINFNERKAFIELVNDYTGYWKKKKICDLRDEKYNHIKKASENANYSLLLGIDFKNSEFFLFDLNKNQNDIKYSEYHFAYHKPVYSLKLNNIKYEKFNFEKICSVIKDIMSE